MVWIRTIIIVLTLGLVLIVGCTGSGERGFKSDRPEFMQQLRVALSQSGIPFREDAGYIFYDKEYKKAFDEVLIKVNESVSGGVSVRYEDAASRQYHKQLLREQGIKYLISAICVIYVVHCRHIIWYWYPIYQRPSRAFVDCGCHFET